MSISPAKGNAPAAVDEIRRKYLFDKLAEVRKSCEWLVTLGAANIFANVLKAAPPENWLRKSTLGLSAAQMVIALFGAMSWLSDYVDPAQVDEKLRQTLERRYVARNISLILLIMSLGLLLLQIW